MNPQLGFADIGVDPAHWHVVQGFRDEERYEAGLAPYAVYETLLSNHLSQEDAQRQMRDWAAETEYTEGLVASAVADDRIDYYHGIDDDSAEWWISVIHCDDFGCFKSCHDEDDNWKEFRGW